MHLSIKSFRASVNQLQSIFLKFLNFLNVKCKFTECYNFSSETEIKGLKLPRKRPSAKQKSLYFVTFNYRLQGIKVYSVNTKSISCMNFQTKLLERFFSFFFKATPGVPATSYCSDWGQAGCKATPCLGFQEPTPDDNASLFLVSVCTQQ